MDSTMKKEEKNSTHIAIPGTRLGVIEEYIPGKGTYQHDGVIYAAIPGVVVVDKSSKEIKVLSARPHVITPRRGDIVIAKVDDAKDKIVFLEIFMVRNKKFENPFSGMIFINQIDSRYIERAKDVFKPGDIVRAKVIRPTNPIQLTTVGRNLGVLLAYCTKCGGLLRRINENTLKCNVCNNIEKRKLANDYEKYYALAVSAKK